MNEPNVFCDECDGNGYVECYACSTEVDCEECDGTGLDDDVIDVDRFKVAAGELQVETGVTWDAVENGRRLESRTKTASCTTGTF